MQIKTIMHFSVYTVIKMTVNTYVSVEVEKLEPSHTAGNVKLCSLFGK